MTAVRRFRLQNADGLHARPIARVVELAGRFRSRLILRHAGREAEASSILELMTLGAGPGAELEAEAQGEDAEALLDAFAELLAQGFGES